MPQTLLSWSGHVQSWVDDSGLPVHVASYEDMDQAPLESNAYFGLDAIGRTIWEMLERPMSVNALCGVLLQRFEVEREQCLADVLPFLEELRGENMIRIGDVQGAGGK
jgi:hypothetical protein